MKNSYFATNNPKQDLYNLKKIDINTIADRLKNKRWLAIDTETTGLSPIDNELLMVQIFDGTDTYILDARSVDLLPLKRVLERSTVVGHNLKFDIKFLRGVNIHCELVYCTMLADKVINCGRMMKFGLKDLLHRYFNIEMEKSVRSTFIGHTGVFTRPQVLYGMDDVLKLIDIAKLQKVEIDKYELNKVIELEMNALLAFADIEYNGLYLDKEAWTNVATNVKVIVDQLHIDMNKGLIKRHPEFKQPQMDLFADVSNDVTINWNSPAQILKLFQRKYKNLEGVGAPGLRKLADPLVKQYVQYKEQSKLYNAYGPEFYKYLHSDGKIHTNFNQVLTTGRVSSSSPNLQQIPANNLYRNAFKPKDSDYVIVSSDFGAQELGVIAFGSQDPVWLKVLSEGGDLHSTCAELVFGNKWVSLSSDPKARKDTPEGKLLRTHVKTISFGLCYGMGDHALSQQLGITKLQAKALIERYFSVFPRIKIFLDRAAEYGLENGMIKTFKPFNRIRFFSDWGITMDNETEGKIKRWSMNSPIQGSAADQCKLALVNLRKYIQTSKVRAKIILTVHDEINCEVHRDDAVVFGKDLGRIMREAANVNVPGDLIKTDVTITDVWSK